MSVDKAIENCCASSDEFLGARLAVEQKRSRELKKNHGDDAEVKKLSIDYETEKIYISDYLALTTQYTRRLFKLCSVKMDEIQTSNAFT